MEITDTKTINVEGRTAAEFDALERAIDERDSQAEHAVRLEGEDGISIRVAILGDLYVLDTDSYNKASATHPRPAVEKIIRAAFAYCKGQIAGPPISS